MTTLKKKKLEFKDIRKFFFNFCIFQFFFAMKIYYSVTRKEIFLSTREEFREQCALKYNCVREHWALHKIILI